MPRTQSRIKKQITENNSNRKTTRRAGRCGKYDILHSRVHAMGLESARYVNISLSCMDATEGSRCCYFLVDPDGAVSKNAIYWSLFKP